VILYLRRSNAPNANCMSVNHRELKENIAVVVNHTKAWWGSRKMKQDPVMLHIVVSYLIISYCDHSVPGYEITHTRYEFEICDVQQKLLLNGSRLVHPRACHIDPSSLCNVAKRKDVGQSGLGFGAFRKLEYGLTRISPVVEEMH
jgi:hypothetical protein